jgi:hypothetical protein
MSPETISIRFCRAAPARGIPASSWLSRSARLRAGHRA